jgi:hypothetical protein
MYVNKRSSGCTGSHRNTAGLRAQRYFFERIDEVNQKAEGTGKSEADRLKAKKPERHEGKKERA